MKIVIITARGGSKRIPRKNVKKFLGKPMIAWSIEAALKSGCFEHILVSTDDEEIARIARDYGAETPFLRPQNLADDFTHAHVAARHALEWAFANWGKIDAFCHIYPAAPLLTPQKIQEGLVCIQNGATNADGFERLNFPLYQILTQDADGGLKHIFEPEKVTMRSQDMPVAYIGAGQLYWFETNYFLEHETAIGPKTAIIEIPREMAIDIDTEEDWIFAEKLAKLSLGL